jgi:hypothetical protein
MRRFDGEYVGWEELGDQEFLLGVSLSSCVGDVIQIDFLDLVDVYVDEVGDQENGEEEEVVQV